MNAGTAARIAADVIQALDGIGLIDAAGNFIAPTPEQDAQIAAAVEAAMKARGVDIPEKVDKAVQLAPLFLAVLG